MHSLKHKCHWFQEPEPVVIQKPTSVVVTVEPEGLFAGSPLSTQPQLKVYDAQVSVFAFFVYLTY